MSNESWHSQYMIHTLGVTEDMCTELIARVEDLELKDTYWCDGLSCDGRFSYFNVIGVVDNMFTELCDECAWKLGIGVSPTCSLEYQYDDELVKIYSRSITKIQCIYTSKMRPVKL